MEDFNNNEEVKIKEREYQRHSIPAAVICKFSKKDLKSKNSFQGFIQNISLGGVSLEIRDDFLFLDDSFLQYTNMEMTLVLNMPDGIHKMNISGIIRWHRRVKKQNMSFLYLGIKFFYLDEDNKAIIKKYLALGTGDKNLMWNLWDNLSIQP